MAEYYQKRTQQRQQQRQRIQQLRALQEQQQQLNHEQSQSQTSPIAGGDDDAFELLQRSLKRFKREDSTGTAVDVIDLTADSSSQGSAPPTPPETQELYQESQQQSQEVKQEAEDEALLGANELQSDEAPAPPKIFFCSRTHSQLTQAVNELKDCPASYMRAIPGSTELRSCVLAVKRLLCVNEDVNSEPMLVNEKCQELRMEKERRRMAGDEEGEGGCKYNQTSFSELRAQSPQVWDIEDITKLASTCEECAYFFSKSKLETAHIVFCPYNYILDPAIRKAVGITLHNSIVVLDEAHNVEDTCRSGASLEITDNMLGRAIKSFDDVIWQGDEGFQPPAYDAVRRMLSSVETWFAVNEELVRDPEDVDDDDCHVLWSTEDALDVLR